MKQFLILVFSALLFSSLHAQEDRRYREDPVDYFNNFQKYSESNADSAWYYLQKLASQRVWASLLRDLLNNSLAQYFLPKTGGDPKQKESAQKQLQIASDMLTRSMADTNKLLLETIRPIYLWKTIGDDPKNVSKVSDLACEFYTSQILPGDLYTNKSGRFGLIICQVLSQYPSLQPLRDQMFSTIDSNLEKNQTNTYDSSSTEELDKRAWYRYLYAYTNYVSAEKAGNKEPFLKKAYDYSPDATDRDHYAAYFYDMIFLFGDERQSFRPDYLEYIAKTSRDTSKILNLFLATALADPEYKQQLESYYRKVKAGSNNFDAYWLDQINASGKTAPFIDLYSPDEKNILSKQYSGKWLLIDFWGTWCGPCRAEHPYIQQFYDTLVAKHPGQIALLTIACRDTREKVITYLQEKHFTFPVALSDGKVEKIFPVDGFPTKILITPQGNFIKVPRSGEWTEFVKKYANL